MKNIFTMLGIFLTLSSFVQAASKEKLQDCKPAIDVQREFNSHLTELRSNLARKLNVQAQLAQSKIKVGGIRGGEIQHLLLKQTDTGCQYFVGNQLIVEHPRQDIK